MCHRPSEKTILNRKKEKITEGEFFTFFYNAEGTNYFKPTKKKQHSE